jgi:hypothetical protein
LHGRARRSALATACFVACLVLPAPLRAQGVIVALAPAALQVDPGAEFDLDLFVTQEGDAFNGFDASIGFDPAALTLVPRSPTVLQEGSLVTSACGSTFHHFALGTSSAAISVVLLCSDTFMTGPGQLYRLHFRASDTPQTTAVTFLPGLQFYNSGLFVNPDSSTNAEIGIGMSPVGVAPLGGAPGLRLAVAPNPTTGVALITLTSERTAPTRLFIVDARGRLVRRLEAPASFVGVRSVRWDGRDASGRRTAPGVYVVSAQQAGKRAAQSLVVSR